MALYDQEGIEYSQITFQDNKAIIDLLEDKQPLGIFHIVNEASLQTAITKDETISRTVKSTHVSNFFLDNRVKDSKIPEKFVIKHTAADVTYTVNGFLEKNKDKLPALVTNLLATSSRSPFVRYVVIEITKTKLKISIANYGKHIWECTIFVCV